MTNEQFWTLAWRGAALVLLLANLVAAIRIMNFVREI
jgi:hypothetical protein